MSKEQSIFELSEMEARKILVDAVNNLIKRCDRHARIINSLDETVLATQRQIDELESDIDNVRTGLDALK